MASNNKVLTIDITNESITIIEATASAKKQSTVHNAIMTFYINIHFNRSQNVVHALRKDAICYVLLRYALLCIFGGQFAVANKKDFLHIAVSPRYYRLL